MTVATETAEQDAVAPNAMALRRSAVSSGPSAESSVQTAFQMSLTVLSFLAFGGYVITMVAQNMRMSQRNGGVGMSAPLPLKTIVVNQNRRPAMSKPTDTLTAVSFGWRKRTLRFLWMFSFSTSLFVHFICCTLFSFLLSFITSRVRFPILSASHNMPHF